MKPAFPASVPEFLHRLDVRRVEPDLRDELVVRMERERRPVARVGEPAVVEAVCQRLVPSEAVPAAALAAFVDEMFDRQNGRADEQHGLMPRAELIPAGFAALDATARRETGISFAELSNTAKDDLLSRAEHGAIAGPDRFDAATWFRRTRELVLLGFGSDPRGMVEMGFPGPSYRTGHVWLSELGVRARAERRPGFLEL